MESIYNGLKQLYDFFVLPIDYLISDLGIDGTPISLGFGNVTWFEMELSQLIFLITALLVWWVFVRFVYKLIKNFFKMVVGWLK